MSKVDIDRRTLFYSLALVVLWLAYMLNRALSGFLPISDEEFYLFTDISNEHKRLYFLKLAQLLEAQTSMYFISCLNVICLLISFVYFKKIIFDNTIVSFFQLVYFCAISTYVFRDAQILLMIVIIIYVIFSENLLNQVSLKKLFSIKFMILLVSVVVLIDFRFQYAVFLLVAFFVTRFLKRFSNKQLFLIFVVISMVSVIAMNFVLNYFYVYGVSLSTFIEQRVERHSSELSIFAIVESFFKHIFAPLPTSLGLRAFESGSTYSSLDDLYRMVYKMYVYVAIIYLVINFRYIPHVFNKWRVETFFIGCFSVMNAIMYTLFSFGGGHERTKIFSIFIITFVFAAVLQLKKMRKQNG